MDQRLNYTAAIAADSRFISSGLQEPSAEKPSKPAKPRKPAKNKKAPTRQATRSWLSDLRYGRSISLETFSKNAWLLVPILAILLAMMGLRYKTKSRMEEIRKLHVELQRSESSKLQEKARYMSLIRETEMLKMVEERHLDLVFQEEPPIVLTRTDKAR